MVSFLLFLFLLFSPLCFQVFSLLFVLPVEFPVVFPVVVSVVLLFLTYLLSIIDVSNCFCSPNVFPNDCPIAFHTAEMC